MNDEIIIESFSFGQEFEINKLVRNVYDEFIAVDYTDEGSNYFYDWIQPSKIVERQKDQKNIWVAFVNAKIVGIIEIRDNNKISLLFVDKQYQGKGIAKSLFKESLSFILESTPDLDKFYVNASPFSIPIYRKLGFVETDEMQEQFGIKFMPMEMLLK